MALKLGIIGYGYMGHWHLRNAPRVEGVSVVAAYDIDPEKVQLARDEGLVAFSSLNEFLASDLINIVLVATPNDTHCALACAAMKAGKHVIVEKPVAMNAAQVDIMAQTARQNNVIFTVHQNRRWDKDYRIASQIVKEGTVGNVYAIQSRLHGSRGAMFGWRAEPEHGGGMIFDWGVHFTDQIMNLFGFDSIKSVFCKMKNVKTDDVEDYFFLVYDLKNGAHVQMEIGTWVLKSLPRWMILGDLGTAYINDFSRSGEIIKIEKSAEHSEAVVTGEGTPTRTFAPRPADEVMTFELPDTPNDLREYYANLCDAVDGKCEPIVKPCQVRAVMHVLDCAFESARTGMQVMI